MLKKFILIFLIFTGNICLAQSNFHKERYLSLRLEFKLDKKDSTATELIKIVKFCQKTLNKHFIKVSPSTPKLHIFLEGNPPSRDFYNIVYFKRSELQHMHKYAILERILTKMMQRTIIGLGADITTKVPSWAVAAHVFDMQLHGILSTEEKYPATRYAIVENKYPSLDDLITQAAPPPDSYWLYRLYAEHCSVFLSTLNKISGNRQKFIAFLKEYRQQNSLELLAKHFPSLNTKITRQRWFIKACTAVCFHILNPYPPEVIYKKVEDLFSISSLRPGGNQVKRIPLEKLFQNEDEKLNFAVITFIEKDFYDLLLTAPEILRPSLKLFIIALQELKAGDTEDFAEQTLVARKEFKKAVDHLKNLINYIDELERSQQNQQENYSNALQVEKLSKARSKKYFPEWNSYLDNLEKKLESIVIE